MNPEALRYTKDHEWVRIEGTAAVIGISDYAQQALGDITFVELPKVGQVLTQGQELAVVESVKAASDVFAPLGGTVKAVNAALNEAPETINTEPYDQGWICRLEPFARAELDGLMTVKQYDEYVAGLA